MSNNDLPEPGSQQWTKAIQQALRAKQFDDEVSTLHQSSGWEPPGWPGTAAEQLAQGVPDIDWVIYDLFPAGICQVNAQQKAGKTTLALNLAHSLLTGNQFVRRFKPNFGSDEAVGYLNLELDRQMFLSWLSDLGMKNEHERLHLYHARERGFGRPDLRNKLALTWFVDWITKNNITVLVIDTLSKLYDPSQWGGGSDPNLAYNRFWQAIETLKREAGLRGIFILHHTGYSEDGADRARGASAMMDNPDVNITYRHAGSQGGAAPDNKRWLSANGRIEPIPEFELDFNPSGRRLFATGSSNKRGDVDIRAKAVAVWEFLHDSQKSGKALVSKTDLLNAVNLPTTGGSLKTRSDAVLDYAILENWVLVVKSGRQKLYGVGADQPPMVERKVIPMSAIAKSRVKKRPGPNARRSSPGDVGKAGSDGV